MASPFRLFRKYQATLLVIAGVLLMFVFVVGDPLMSYIGSAGRGNGGGGQNPRDVAVRWDGGKLSNAELAQLVMRRRVVNAFVRQVEYEGAFVASDGGRNIPPPLRVQPLGLPERPDQNVERDIVRMVISANAARRMGMRISDEQVVQYLQQLGRGYVSVDRLREIISRLQVGRGGASVDYVLDALRDELLARNFLASYTFALDTVLPEQRWDDWLRVNDRVAVEAATIQVDRFQVDVPDPTETELTAFFEEYKNREPQPDRVGGIEMASPHPGFAVPRKVELQFVRADYAAFLEQALAAVSDEEIEKFYDDNKDPYYVVQATDLFDAAADDADPADSETEQPDAATERPDADQADTDAEEDDAGEAEADDADSETGPAIDAAPAEGDQSSVDRLPRRSVFRLAAFAEETDADVAESAETETTNDDAADVEEAVESSDDDLTVATGDSTWRVDNSADEQSATTVDEGAAEPSATETAELAAGTRQGLNEPGAGSPKEFLPLEEVREEIRREVALLKVSEQLETMFGDLETKLDTVYKTHLIAVLDAQDVGKEPPPPPDELADLTPLAQEHGLECQKTVPISRLQLQDLPVGQSHKPNEETVPFFDLAFSRDLELYEPVVTFDSEANRYLVMKISDTPGSVPKLDDVRDEVVRAWRRRQAAELALKHAQAEAKQAESAESLEEFFADDDDARVTKTDFFSRYTAGTVSRQTEQAQFFRLSKPEGIEGADFEMMDTIFGLGEGEVAAVLCHDHSIAYLLRVVERELTPAELRQAFLSEADRWYGLAAMNNMHRREAVSFLLADMLESAGVTWQRPADQPYREDQ